MKKRNWRTTRVVVSAVAALLLLATGSAFAVPLIEMDFNDSSGAASLVNRGSIAATGGFVGDAAFTTIHGPLNSGGWGGDFDAATTGYVNFGDLDLLDGLSDFTITAWVNPSTTGSQHHIASKIDGAGNTGFDYAINGNEQWLQVNGTFGPTGNQVPVRVYPNEWTFVAVTYSGTSATCYKGTAGSDTLASQTVSLNGGSTTANSTSFEVGGGDNTGHIARDWEQWLDNVRVYSSILSSSELVTVKNFNDVSVPTDSPVIGLFPSPALHDIVSGGSVPFDAGVRNIAPPGSPNLEYTLAAAFTTGSGTFPGPVSPNSGNLAPGALQVSTVTASSTNIGDNIITFTATDGDASNNPQSGNVTLRVFDHASPYLTSALFDFGTVPLGTPVGPATFDLCNAAGFRVGLDLTSITQSGSPSTLSGWPSYGGLAPGSCLAYSATIDTSVVGPYHATFVFHLSDDQGWAAKGATVLDDLMFEIIGNVTDDGTPVPEPAGLALVGMVLLAQRNRRR